MRLLPVSGTPFQFTCLKCQQKGTAGDDQPKVYADLDGPPFLAYYHAPCVSDEIHWREGIVNPVVVRATAYFPKVSL